MLNGTVYLKVKNKSLAAEAKIIRKEERKAKARGFHVDFEHPNRKLLTGLTEHRKTIVREEQRATLLAYAFARKRRCGEIEMPPGHILVKAGKMLVNFRIIDRNANGYEVIKEYVEKQLPENKKISQEANEKAKDIRAVKKAEAKAKREAELVTV